MSLFNLYLVVGFILLIVEGLYDVIRTRDWNMVYVKDKTIALTIAVSCFCYLTIVILWPLNIYLTIRAWYCSYKRDMQKLYDHEMHQASQEHYHGY